MLHFYLSEFKTTHSLRTHISTSLFSILNKTKQNKKCLHSQPEMKHTVPRGIRVWSAAKELFRPRHTCMSVVKAIAGSGRFGLARTQGGGACLKLVREEKRRSSPEGSRRSFRSWCGWSLRTPLKAEVCAVLLRFISPHLFPPVHGQLPYHQAVINSTRICIYSFLQHHIF